MADHHGLACGGDLSAMMEKPRAPCSSEAFVAQLIGSDFALTSSNRISRFALGAVNTRLLFSSRQPSILDPTTLDRRIDGIPNGRRSGGGVCGD